MARFCPSRAFILDLGGWGFAVPFYFVQDCSKKFGHYSNEQSCKLFKSGTWMSYISICFQPSVRKTHNGGRKHKDNVRFYYTKWMEEQAQSLIDQTSM